MRNARLNRPIVLAAVLLVAGAALCVFDADTGAGLDLCLAAIVLAGVPALGAVPLMSGSLAPVPVLRHPPIWPRPLAPPPRT